MRDAAHTDGTALFASPLYAYNKYGTKDEDAVRSALRAGHLFSARGRIGRELATHLAAELGAHGCVLVSSGTAAVHVALAASGVDFGDEVITTPLTDTGTLLPILLLSAIPVFADIESDTLAISARTVEPLITPRTRAIVLVHYGGFPAPVEQLVELGRRHGIPVIEDCAQAQGTTLRDRSVGTFGALGAFSTNDTKHVSCGDGGFVLATDQVLLRRARLYADKGFDRETAIRDPIMVAPNYRMTELQAAVLSSQWDHLAERVRARRSFAAELDRLVDERGGSDLRAQRARSDGDASYFSYLMLAEDEAKRDRIVAALRRAGAPAHPGNLFDLMYRLSVLRQSRPRFLATLDHPAYESELCPQAAALNARLIRLEMYETYGAPELAAIAEAFEYAGGPQRVSLG